MKAKTRAWPLLGVLYLSILLFTGSTLYCLVQIQNATRVMEKYTYDVSWALMQLQLELGRFINAVEIYHYGGIDHETLLLRYDILWSRTPILLSGQLRKSLADNPKTLRLVQLTESNIRKLEPELTRLKPGMPDYQQIMMTLAPLQEPLSYSLASMMQKNINVYSGNDKRFGQLRDALLFMVLGLVISVILLSALLVREARRHFRTARVDPLTGLANRLALLEKMESYVSRDTPFGLILIDINDFRDINSKFGYSTGDILLQELAKRLRALCENGEWVARLGGDQLAMLQRDSSDLRQVRELVARVLHAIKQDIIIDSYPFRLEVGIGIAFFPTDSNQTQELLSRAEQALFHSRKTHVPYVIYDSSLLNETARRKHLASDMVMALEHNALELYYQPIVNLESGRCEAVEALLRWRHPELGFIPPNEVIQVAEEFQLAEKLGSWVLNTACEQLHQWQHLGLVDLQMCVNISPGMYQRNLLKLVAKALMEHHIPASCLVLEVTEDTTMREVKNSLQLMQDLSQQGVHLALDDFGTGYSSLSYLQKLPVSKVKIDRSFIQGIDTSIEAAELVANICRMGSMLGKKLVCEGIETQGQLDVLRSLTDIHLYGQGYLFSRPEQASKAYQTLLEMEERWLARRAPNKAYLL
ncbi:putative bifunctional diguanylate cyclase/phosphodiesterase [Aeromonas mytilicola]|uniref:Bifunctional diguanylate cyclase/phosphodiesterase n=1 Tax=Aeromonas rivipollensis TaxID=948519 RepID=A0ABX0CV70_9GAMM|nr:bifunctional diguanylate cyclase/phosphodiesterase [Aeromonas rivipollensis]NEY06586.1 bifunctional diguanylate cyclase/phosphodiesterase [Aeromonas rivipollensis]